MKKGQKMPEHLRLKHIERMKSNPIRYWLGKKRIGYKLSDSGREKIVSALKSRTISESVILHTAKLNKGKFGKNHPKWTDDKKRPLYQSIRSLYQYKDWRNNIFVRDNFTCQSCRKRGGDIEADHFPKMFIEIIRGNLIDTVDKAITCEDLWSAEGRTLCRTCHEKTFRLSKR